VLAGGGGGVGVSAIRERDRGRRRIVSGIWRDMVLGIGIGIGIEGLGVNINGEEGREGDERRRKAGKCWRVVEVWWWWWRVRNDGLWSRVVVRVVVRVVAGSNRKGKVLNNNVIVY
jgi:hypothetical protein